MKKILVLICLFLLCNGFAIIASAQTPDYASLYEITGKDQKIELRDSFQIVDIKSQLLIELNLEQMKQEKVQVAVAIFAKRGENIINLPEKALSQLEIFPNVDPNGPRRPQLVISGNDSTYEKIVLDLRSGNITLKALGNELQEYDHLFIKFTEIQAARDYSVELELVETGLSAPSEIAAPLMLFNVDDTNMLGLGVSGIWHYKNRSGLQNFFGFGLTMTPNSIDLAELKNSQIGLIPTISIGFGKTNPDIILLGWGWLVGTEPTKNITYVGLNLAWIGRIIQ